MRLNPIVATSLFAIALVATALIASAGHAKAEQPICKNDQLAFAPASALPTAKRQLVQKVQIDYPQAIVLQDRNATVTLRYTVEADGHIDHVEVVHGVGAAFIQQAKMAVSQWVYSPSSMATPDVTAVVRFKAAP